MSSLGSGHPGEEELLRYCDGELSGSESAAVRKHLASCWQCRAEREAFERTIGEYVRYQKKVLEPSLPAPPEPWFDIYRRFDEIDAKEDRLQFLMRAILVLRGAFSSPRRWAPVAAAIVLAVAVHATIQLGLWNSGSTGAPHRPAGRQETRGAGLPDLPPDAPAPAAEKRAVALPPHALRSQRRTATPGDELAVWAALRRLDADLGDPVEVTRSGEEVVVSGVGVAPERQRRIRDEIGSLPRVAIRFQEPAAEAAETEAQAPGAVSVGAQPGRTQLELEKRLGGRPAFEQFANRMVETSEALMSRAHALRRLAQRFPASVEEQMSAAEREVLKSLCREHSAALLRLVGEAQTRMEPVLAGASAAPAQLVPAGSFSWQDETEELFNATRRFESLLVALLGGAAGGSPPRDPAAELRAGFAELRARAEGYDRLTASR